MLQQQAPTYFKGLNGLRFIAASLVLIDHAEWIILHKNGLGYYNFIHHLLSTNAQSAVMFFFVLSGFLITFLLLKEYETSQTINIKNFYLKRVVRIWPLYYLLLFIVLIVAPMFFYLSGQDYIPLNLSAIGLYMCFLPNVVDTLSIGTKMSLKILWSIGVEEQFYLIWAPIIKFFKRRVLQIMLGIVILKIMLRILFHFYSGHSSSILFMIDFVNQLAIENMAIGGIGAYLVYYYREKIHSSWLFNYLPQIVIYALLFFKLSTNEDYLDSVVWLKNLYHILFANSLSQMIMLPVLFLYLILNVSLNAKSIIKTENKVFDYLGKISYGLYMYHWIAISVTVFLLKYANGVDKFLYSCLFYILAFGINIAIATLSFEYFEKRFLKLRPH